MFVVRNPRTKQRAAAGAPGVLLFAAIALCSLCYVVWKGSAIASGPIGDDVDQRPPCSKTNDANDANVSASSARENQKLNQRLDPFPTMPGSFQEAVRWIVSARKERSETATLVQIGANDGQTSDPFYGLYGEGRMDEWHSDWTALLVEPQPELNSRAATFHAPAAAPESSSAWRFYNGAVAGPDRCRNGTIEFCETRTPGIGDWRTQGLTNTVDAARCKGKEAHMQLMKRPCVSSFSELLEHASPRFREVAFNEHLRSYNLDFLLIDTDLCADFSILLLIDWNVLKPHCIRYEQHVIYGNVENVVQRANVDAALDAAASELDVAVTDTDAEAEAARHAEYKAMAAARRAKLAALAAAAEKMLESKGYTTVDQGMDVMACLVESDFEPPPKKLSVGDRAEGNWKMEGDYYGGFVTASTPETITIQYDDDASFETLPISDVRPESLSAYIERLRLMAGGDFPPEPPEPPTTNVGGENLRVNQYKNVV